jgi:hypothetical protein
MAPTQIVEVNHDDEVSDVIELSYGIQYIFNNDQVAPAAIYEAGLPAIAAGDVGRRVHVKVHYDTDPLTDPLNIGYATLKVNNGSGDMIRRGGTVGSNAALKVNDEELVLTHDGVVPGVWYLV